MFWRLNLQMSNKLQGRIFVHSYRIHGDKQVYFPITFGWCFMVFMQVNPYPSSHGSCQAWKSPSIEVPLHGAGFVSRDPWGPTPETPSAASFRFAGEVCRVWTKRKISKDRAKGDLGWKLPYKSWGSKEAEARILVFWCTSSRSATLEFSVLQEEALFFVTNHATSEILGPTTFSWDHQKWPVNIKCPFESHKALSKKEGKKFHKKSPDVESWMVSVHFQESWHLISKCFFQKKVSKNIASSSFLLMTKINLFYHKYAA